MKSFDLMFELGAEEWQLIFQQFMVQNNGCLIIGKT
jgi:hypothetical protein